MKFLFLIFVSSGNVDLTCIHTQHISAVVNKMANFKCSNFTPEAVNNLSVSSEKPYCGAINYFYDVIEYICRESPCFAHSMEGSLLCINVL